jgi:hypothetical protein
MRLDAGLGGEHRADIQSRRDTVAVDAAATYMARGELRKAKDAADLAEAAGVTGGKLALVRRSLERKATNLYDEAVILARSSRPDDRASAASKAKEARSLVPTSSPVHADASKLLAAMRN